MYTGQQLDEQMIKAGLKDEQGTEIIELTWYYKDQHLQKVNYDDFDI
jgi:hypothetical protein